MLAPDEIKSRIAEGIMAFPATPFAEDGSLDRPGLESHVAFLAKFHPTALVAAGGAGARPYAEAIDAADDSPNPGIDRAHGTAPQKNSEVNS